MARNKTDVRPNEASARRSDATTVAAPTGERVDHADYGHDLCCMRQAD